MMSAHLPIDINTLHTYVELLKRENMSFYKRHDSTQTAIDVLEMNLTTHNNTDLVFHAQIIASLNTVKYMLTGFFTIVMCVSGFLAWLYQSGLIHR